MDLINPIITGPTLDATSVSKAKDAASIKDEQKKIEVAKNFESVFVTKLIDEMKDTIPESEIGDDGSGGQMQGLFWMYLSQGVSEQGGLGLWKDVYKDMNKTAPQETVNTLI